MVDPRDRWLYVMVCGLLTNAAHAHGEDILVAVCADVLSIVLSVIVLLTWRRARPHRVAGLVGCAAGTIAGNLAVSRLPYMQYENLIIAVGFIAPLAATMSAISAARHLATRRKRRCIQ